MTIVTMDITLHQHHWRGTDIDMSGKYNRIVRFYPVTSSAGDLDNTNTNNELMDLYCERLSWCLRDWSKIHITIGLLYRNHYCYKQARTKYESCHILSNVSIQAHTWLITMFYLDGHLALSLEWCHISLSKELLRYDNPRKHDLPPNL